MLVLSRLATLSCLSTDLECYDLMRLALILVEVNKWPHSVRTLPEPQPASMGPIERSITTVLS